MDTLAEIKMAQAYLTQEISRTFEGLIAKVQAGNEAALPNERVYETMYPLSTDSAIFKGTKPTCVMLGNERVVATTWKNVFKTVILNCNSNTNNHKALMALRNKILGRERILLSDVPGEMYRPFKIDTNLYAETHYDTETLMNVLLHRILDEVGYDYGNISVGVRN